MVYPEHLTQELDYELELAVVLKKGGKHFTPEDAMEYVGGYVIFNDITARDIQRREMKSGVFSFCKGIDTFCPLGPWIVTADEIPDPHNLAMELRVNGETAADLAFEQDVGEDSGNPVALFADGIQRGRCRLDRHGIGSGRIFGRSEGLVSEGGRRDGMRNREDRRAAEQRDFLGRSVRFEAKGASHAGDDEVGSCSPRSDAMTSRGTFRLGNFLASFSVITLSKS